MTFILAAKAEFEKILSVHVYSLEPVPLKVGPTSLLSSLDLVLISLICPYRTYLLSLGALPMFSKYSRKRTL